MEEVPRALIYSNDPQSNQSYGIIAGSIMKYINNDYDWHIINKEYSNGRPKFQKFFPNKPEGYWEWNSGSNVIQRYMNIFPQVFDTINPEFFISINDLDNIGNVRFGKPLHCPWIQYFPIDNEDFNTLYDCAKYIANSDVSVVMSKFAFDLINNNKRLQRMNVKADRYIYPFIDNVSYHKFTTKDFDKKMEAWKEKNGIAGKKILLFIGRPGWRKNIEFLLGAFKELCNQRDDVVLYLHSDFNDPAREFNIKKHIHAQKIDESLISSSRKLNWQEGFPKPYLALLYNIAEVYVTTHGGEGFCLPIAEAMACETPFVATNTTTTEEFGRDNPQEDWKRGLGAKIKVWDIDHNVKRPYVDIDDFVEKVNLLLDDDNLRKKMGRNGRRWVNKNCGIEAITNNWKKLFEDIDVPKVKIIGEKNG